MTNKKISKQNSSCSHQQSSNDRSECCYWLETYHKKCEKNTNYQKNHSFRIHQEKIGRKFVDKIVGFKIDPNEYIKFFENVLFEHLESQKVKQTRLK